MWGSYQLRPAYPDPARPDRAEPSAGRWPGRFTLLSRPRLMRHARSEERIGKTTLVGELLRRGAGSRLPGALRARLERRTGQDLGGVRLHTDAAAAESARSLGADAFTMGQDVYFAAGMYRPGSSAGDKLIAHEVAHTVQQRGVGGAGPLELSSPGDPAEREADAFAEGLEQDADADAGADADAPAEPARILPPTAHSLITPASRPALLRSPGVLDVINPVPPAFIVLGNKQLYNGGGISEQWPLIPQRNIPLAQGAIVVDGVPITYHASLSGGASAKAVGRYSPGMASMVMYSLDEVDQALWVAAPAARYALMKGYPTSPRTLNTTFTSDASASFIVEAHAGGKAGAAIFGVFDVTAEAGLNAVGSANASANFIAGITATLNNGELEVSITRIDVKTKASVKFTLGAYAAITVGLKVPEIPFLTRFTQLAQSWPVVGRFIPDLSKPLWSKTFRSEWSVAPLGEYSWDRTFSVLGVFGSSPGAAHWTGVDDGMGFDAGQLFSGFLGTKGDKSIPKDHPGPSEKEKEGPSPGAVAAARAGASAHIATAREALEVEKTWTAEELVRARSGAIGKRGGAGKPAVKQAGVGGPGDSGPVPAPGTQPDPEEEAALLEFEGELEARAVELEQAGGELDDAQSVMGEVAPSASAEDGSTRSSALHAYEGVAEGADDLGLALEEGTGKYQRPELETKPTDPNAAQDGKSEAEMDAARDAARSAAHQHHEVDARFMTELSELDEIIANCGGNSELIPYVGQLRFRHDQVANLRAQLEGIERHLVDLRATLDSPTTACDAVELAALEAEIETLRQRFEALAPRAEEPWDTSCVRLEHGRLLLIDPSNIRRRFYDQDYHEDVTSRIANLATRTVTYIDPMGNRMDRQQWMWGGPPLSPLRAGQIGPARGCDEWWWMEHWTSDRRESNESPTIAHDSPSMARHWNAQGRLQTQAERDATYNGGGHPDFTLGIEPACINSTKGSRGNGRHQPDPDGPVRKRPDDFYYNPQVGVDFRAR